MDKSKRLFLKPKQKRSFRRRLLPIQTGDQIDYTNVSLISRFISEQGKILSRRVNRLTLKQQRLITLAIKQARILSLLPFLNNENYERKLEKGKLAYRPADLRARNTKRARNTQNQWKKDTKNQSNTNFNSNSNGN